MGISLPYGCCQIESSTHDLAETRAFLIDILGGGPIEQELAREIDTIIPDEGYGCDHVGLGQAVFQVNQPAAGMLYKGQPSVHQSYLDRVGRCVTNLNFFIDDHVHARSLLAALGASIHIEGPSSAAQALADYGLDNTRPGGSERPFMFWGTRDLIGLDLEIMEPNFLRFAEQVVQYPAFVRPRPVVGDDNLLLQRLRVVVADLDATRANLEAMFNPGSLSRPYRVRSGPLGRTFRIWLGGIEIEYCEPVSSRGALGKQLDARGPGVVAIDFSAHDPEVVIVRAQACAETCAEPLWTGDETACGRMIASRSVIGFDVVLLRDDDQLR